MGAFIDFIPVLLFFVAYRYWGIYTATAVLMIATAIQVGVYWLKHRRIESVHGLTLLLVFLLGGATLFFHDEAFIKWKPTVINWVLTVLFLGSPYVLGEPFMKRLMQKKMRLSPQIWSRLNLSWGLFFLVMGGLNLIVAYRFSTAVWVDFKLFGVLGCTIFFVLLQAMCLTRYLAKEKIVEPMG